MTSELRGIIFSWPRLSGVYIPWTGFRTMKMLSCPVFIIDFGTLEQRGSTHFLFHGLARITSSFLPFFLPPESLITVPLLGDRGTLVVPTWPSAPFWPLIFTEGLSPIISDAFEIPMGTDVFCLGNYQGALFGSPNFRSRVIFLRILC